MLTKINVNIYNNMSSRNTSFDGIRAIAILGIVGCHMCYGLDGMSWLGLYLGGTFNCVFFSLSALIYGEKILGGKTLALYEA